MNMALQDLIEERRKKLKKYERQEKAYPARVRREVTLKKIVESFRKFEGRNVSVVGRLMAWRDQGKIIFGPINDGSSRLQLVFNQEKTENFSLVKETFDIGDFVEARGKIFKTKRGEKSLAVSRARIITKSLRPLPDKWAGLQDIEKRLRERYLDILFNPEIKELFHKKSIFWDTVRDFLKKAGFLEVETPVLESIPGGAEAEPFITHMNALNTDFYLRISLELPLKKLLVAGYEKVFEIGRIFRNEGIDREHLQDYTQMECYWAYADYHDMMELTETLYKKIIKNLFNTFKITSYGSHINWETKWKRLQYYDIFKNKTGLDLSKATITDLKDKAKKLRLKFPKKAGAGRLIDLIFKKAVRPYLINPCFVIDHPLLISPLAKKSEKNPERVERFQIFAAGVELGNGFSELNDPIDQRKRFKEQMKLREKGDREAHRLDEEFLRALEYGMPPAAGFGMSERLFAVLMDKPIRETVIFPLMKRADFPTNDVNHRKSNPRKLKC